MDLYTLLSDHCRQCYRLSNMLAGTVEDKPATVQSSGGSAKAGGKKRRK